MVELLCDPNLYSATTLLCDAESYSATLLCDLLGENGACKITLGMPERFRPCDWPGQAPVGLILSNLI